MGLFVAHGGPDSVETSVGRESPPPPPPPPQPKRAKKANRSRSPDPYSVVAAFIITPPQGWGDAPERKVRGI
jgi:hypothetical protein